MNIDNFIDLVIRAKNGDEFSNISLHNHYTSMAYDYWTILPEKGDIKILKRLLSIAHKSVLVDMRLYLDVFLYIGSLSCEITLEKSMFNIDIKYLISNIEKVILLVNHTGQFTFKAYLDSHYAGYELIGIPSSKSTYDNNESCPIYFMAHDSSHIRYVVGNKTISNWLRPVYKNMRDKDDLIIMVIFLYIHEAGFKESFHLKVNPLFSRAQLKAVYDIVGKEFIPYRSIILSKENLDNTINVIALYIKQYTKEYIEMKRYQLHNIDIQSDYVYFILGLNYVYTYIKNNDVLY